MSGVTLEEIAAALPRAATAPVPAWTFGCFHRRSITYAKGQEDAATRVIWVQSQTLTGDLRIPASRPDVRGRMSLADCTPEELVLLAQAEGGVADTAFQGGRMDWNNWTAFQPYEKWPEPGDLRRVGDCLVEFAPSGVYVEDWRFQPGSSGVLAGLRLVSETGPDGVTRPREGGLVIAGDHAILTLGRRHPLPSAAPVHEQLRAAADPHALAATAFDCEASYIRRGSDGEDRIELSTNPFVEGLPSAIRDGFQRGPSADLLIQLVRAHGGEEVRTWSVQDISLKQGLTTATATGTYGRQWLEREAGTLINVSR